MAGIGFELRRLARADRFSDNLRGMAYATVTSSGPWLFTCAALAAVQMLAANGAEADLRRLSILIIYNFSFSLVISGPVVLVVTRCLADAIHLRDISEVSGLLVGALALLFGVTALIGIPLYGFAVELSTAERMMALAGLFLTSGIWLVSTFLSALKSYGVISGTFAVGMVLAVGSAAALSRSLGTLGLLGGFTLGLASIFFGLMARILAEFPGSGIPSWHLLHAFRRYWDLALVGLIYNAAVWVDKWIMWFAPGSSSPGQGLHSHATYESAMFMAYLSVVPAMALFLVVVETRFYEIYTRFYRDISEHATLNEIRANHARLVREAINALRRTGMLQAIVCGLGIAAAPLIVAAAGAGIEVLPVFRYGLFGALFHVLLLLTQAALAYFDLRRALLAVTTVFFVLNAGLTALSVQFGEEYHGYGYGLAALLTFALAYVITASSLARLPYLTFVANNAAVRKRSRPAAAQPGLSAPADAIPSPGRRPTVAIPGASGADAPSTGGLAARS